MKRLPPSSTRTYTLFPNTTLFRSPASRPLAALARRPLLLRRARLRGRQYPRQCRRDGGLDEGAGLRFAAPGNRHLSYAALAAGIPPHDAEYRDRAASGVHRALQARRLVAVAGQHRPVAHRVHQVPGRPGPRARRPLARCPRLGAGSMTALRSLLFNAFFYGWTALCVVIGLPLLLGPRSEERRVGKEWGSTCRTRGAPHI